MTVEREPVARPTSDTFQEGYWQGRDRASRDYASLASQAPVQNNPTPFPGILLGMLIATVVGGSAVAFLYFDNRLDTIVDETETLTETLEDRETASEEGERSDADNLSSGSRFDSENLPSTESVDPNSPARPANPFSRPIESATPPVDSSSLEQPRNPFFRSSGSSVSPTDAATDPDASAVEGNSPNVDIESAPDVSE